MTRAAPVPATEPMFSCDCCDREVVEDEICHHEQASVCVYCERQEHDKWAAIYGHLTREQLLAVKPYSPEMHR